MISGNWIPRIGKRWLLLVAGLVWMAVGMVLAVLAVSWLRPMPLNISIPFGLAGILIALAAYRLGFVSLATRNIQRIQRLPDRAHIFAFQASKSYLMIGVMATSGAILRHSAFPKPELAVIYLGMGGALFLSSLSYYPRVWEMF